MYWNLASIGNFTSWFLLAKVLNAAELLPGGNTWLFPWLIFFQCNGWQHCFPFCIHGSFMFILRLILQSSKRILLLNPFSWVALSATPYFPSVLKVPMRSIVTSILMPASVFSALHIHAANWEQMIEPCPWPECNEKQPVPPHRS